MKKILIGVCKYITVRGLTFYAMWTVDPSDSLIGVGLS